MRTAFAPEALARPDLADAERNLRACMHCGICTATCPTYVLTGDERDGPRGRIVMMQAMLEQGGAPSAETVFHIDRCLSCLACRTACPSGVDYAALVDTARAHIETHYRRPLAQRLLRRLIATVMTRPALVGWGLRLARATRPLSSRFPGAIGRLARTAAKTGRKRAVPFDIAVREGGATIAMMPGCIQAVAAPEIDEAARRVLARRGSATLPLDKAGCCGALSYHLGREEEARAFAKRVIETFERDAPSAEAVTITATGCAAHLKEYPRLFADDPAWRARAEAFAGKVKDLSALVTPRAGWPQRRLRVAWQPACSAQNGLRTGGEVEAILREAGFDLVSIPESHLCCGSAGSYSLLQPGLSMALRERKLGNIAATRADVVATGNIGCQLHLSGPDAPPIVHYVQLMDWVEGGARPEVLGG